MTALPTPEQLKLADSAPISTEPVPATTEPTPTDAPTTAADSAPPAATAGSPPPVTSSPPAPAPTAETTTTTTTEAAPAPAAPPRERELVADPRLNTLRAMFPDFDDSLLQSVLDSVQGNTDRAIDALLGMSDPDYQGEPGAQQTQQRPQTQEELDEQLARTLMLQDQQDHDNAARQHAWQAQQQQQQGRPEPRRQGSSGGPERDTMQEFSEQFNKFAESGRKTLGTFFNKVKAKIQEFDQPQGGQSSGNATHGGVGGDTYPYESQYNPYPDTSHQQRNDNSNNPNPHQQMPAYYDPNAGAGDGDRFGSGPHSPTGYDATPAPPTTGTGGPGTPAPPSTQSGAPQIDGGKLGMLPKRPVSLLATSPQPSSAHTGAPPSSDDDDALEYAENPFEEDKTRK